MGIIKKGVVGSEVGKQAEGIGGMLKHIHLNSFSLGEGLLYPHCGVNVLNLIRFGTGWFCVSN